MNKELKALADQGARVRLKRRAEKKPEPAPENDNKLLAEAIGILKNAMEDSRQSNHTMMMAVVKVLKKVSSPESITLPAKKTLRSFTITPKRTGDSLASSYKVENFVYGDD